MKKVIIYTDGACSGNPGIGGWGAVLLYNGTKKEISGYDKSTTNNRMELFAVIQALRCLNQRCECEVYSDSQYIIDAFNKDWLTSWQNNNWKTASKGEVKNVDLWRALLYEVNKHNVTFIKVKGHADVELNELCDRLARGEVERYQKILQDGTSADDPTREYSAMAVVFCQDKILTTLENVYGNTALSCPKGHIEAGETAIKAAIRECAEETGVSINESEAAAVLDAFEVRFTTPDGRKICKTITPVLFEIPSEREPKPSEERIKSVRYMPVSQFLKDCSYENVKNVVNQALVKHI